jgi:hypothetical protein
MTRLFYEVSEGVSQLHQGVEITFMANPQPDVPYTLKGFLSIGDWIYEGDAITRTQDEDQNVLDTETEILMEEKLVMLHSLLLDLV